MLATAASTGLHSSHSARTCVEGRTVVEDVGFFPQERLAAHAKAARAEQAAAVAEEAKRRQLQVGEKATAAAHLCLLAQS
jgi:hypothetical protein